MKKMKTLDQYFKKQRREDISLVSEDHSLDSSLPIPNELPHSSTSDPSASIPESIAPTPIVVSYESSDPEDHFLDSSLPVPNELPHSSTSDPSASIPESVTPTPVVSCEPSELDINSLASDPALRTRISDYPIHLRDQVRREYILRGPCRPSKKKFPLRKAGGEMRRFNTSWYDKYEWMEYSEHKNAVFCLYCYLFKNETGRAAGGDAFVSGGFYYWNKISRCDRHVGSPNSAHNSARIKFENLLNGNQSIQAAIYKQSEVDKSEYRTRLTASVDVLRILLRQGLAFRGHDESEESGNRGNFFEILTWYAQRNENVDRVILNKAPQNNQMTGSSIQREIINACAKETSKLIIEDLGDAFFTILVDESSDISQQEQLAVCLRYVDRSGRVIERFLGVVHVTSTTAASLKKAVFNLLLKHSLSPSRIRGQGYDGASNMKGEINGLKTLIMKECSFGYYVHCFAHQLQLTLVSVSSKNEDCIWLFEKLGYLLNVIGSSCKRKELIREKQGEEIARALGVGEIQSGSGQNQEASLRRPSTTRWGSYYRTLLSLSSLFSPLCSVLASLGDICSNEDDKVKAQGILHDMRSFHFIFIFQLMLRIFGLTHDLNLALQRKDQDIVNSMSLVGLVKEKLQKMRDGGWESLLDRVCSFCRKHDVEIPNMEHVYAPWGRSRRGREKVSYLHHFRVEVFMKVIDIQLQELNNRFNEVNTELLLCMACLSPKNLFGNFDMQKLIKLATFYPDEFSRMDISALEFQLENFISDMRRDERFHGLDELGELSMKLVETGKHIAFDQVYMLLKLTLTLPVATTSVERSFSAMNYIKNKLRNSMGDDLLNDCLVTFIESDISSEVTNDAILNRFQAMKPRRKQL